MPLRTMTASGNWNDPTKWEGGIVPSGADTYKVNGGLTVHVTASTTFGPGAGQCGEIGSDVKFHVDGGVEFINKGTVRWDCPYASATNGWIQLGMPGGGGGVKWLFDADAGQDGFLTYFTYMTPTFKSYGAPGNRNQFGRKPGSAQNASGIRWEYGNNLVPDCSYTDFLDCGDADHFGVHFSTPNGSYTPTVTECDFKNSSMAFRDGSTARAGVFTHNRVKSPPNTSVGTIAPGCPAMVEGIGPGGQFHHNSFQAPVYLSNLAINQAEDGTIFTHNVFTRGWVTAGTQNWGWMKDTYIGFEGGTSSDGMMVNVHGSLLRCHALWKSTIGNPHILNIGRTAQTKVKDTVIEVVNVDANEPGDGFFFGFPTYTDNPSYWEVTGCIHPPVHAGHYGGRGCLNVLSLQGAPGLRLKVDHNTFANGPYCPAVRYGESHGGHKDLFTSFRSNLIWDTGTTEVSEGFTDAGSPIVDAIDPANADYNAMSGVAAGTRGKGYTFKNTEYAGSPGAHDKWQQAPQFFDPSRNFVTWGITKDATIASLPTHLDKVHATEALLVNDPSLVTDYHAYLYDGFRPTNPALANADYETANALVSPTGGWIGAVAGVAAGPLAAPTVSFSNVASTGLTATCGSATGGTGPYSYTLQQAPDSAGSPGGWADVAGPGSSTSWAVSGLDPSTKYWFRVRVTDSAGTPATADGTAASATTAAAAAPPTAIDLTAAATPRAVGAEILVTITLDQPAPAGGTAVTLSSDAAGGWNLTPTNPGA